MKLEGWGRYLPSLPFSWRGSSEQHLPPLEEALATNPESPQLLLDEEEAGLEEGEEGVAVPPEQGGRLHVRPWLILGVILGGLLVVALVALVVIHHRLQAPPPLAIVISFDGLRASYLTDPELAGAHPTFDAIAEAGVSLPIQPIFPSLTFPNHWALATGLFAESNGIVANEFFDPQLNETFSMTAKRCVEDPEEKWWWGEPLWITAVKQNLLSAAYYWPGSEASIQSLHATYWFPYNATTPYLDRVQQAVAWAHLPLAQRPSLIMLYFEEMDKAGHIFGPDNTTAIRLALEKVDNLLAGLREGLKDVPNVSWILVSDHGMAQLVPNATVALQTLPEVDSALLLPNQTRVPFRAGTMMHLWPPEDSTEKLHRQLIRGLSKLKANASCFLKSQIPSHYHYQNCRRIPPVLVTAKLGYWLGLSPNDGPGVLVGKHGYDNFAKEMRGIFIAEGPNFDAGYREVDSSMPNVQVYNLVCSILGLSPAPNNGSDPTTLPFWNSRGT